MPTHFIRLLAVAAFLACTSANAAVVLIANLAIGNESVSPPGNLTPVGPNPGDLRPLTAGAGAADPNAIRPNSFGTAIFTLNDAQTALSFFATVFNIDIGGGQTPGANDNLVAAHIHANNSIVQGSTLTAPVVWGFFGNPFNDTQNNSADNILAKSDCTPFSTGVGGTCAGTWDLTEGNNTTLATQLPNLLAGHAYINFHTSQFPGGEIRGFLQAPEPGSLALVACALGAIYFSRRSRQKAQARG